MCKVRCVKWLLQLLHCMCVNKDIPGKLLTEDSPRSPTPGVLVPAEALLPAADVSAKTSRKRDGLQQMGPPVFHR